MGLHTMKVPVVLYPLLRVSVQENIDFSYLLWTFQTALPYRFGGTRYNTQRLFLLQIRFLWVL
jgi:hypothetical protein